LSTVRSRKRSPEEEGSEKKNWQHNRKWWDKPPSGLWMTVLLKWTVAGWETQKELLENHHSIPGKTGRCRPALRTWLAMRKDLDSLRRLRPTKLHCCWNDRGQTADCSLPAYERSGSGKIIRPPGQQSFTDITEQTGFWPGSTLPSTINRPQTGQWIEKHEPWIYSKTFLQKSQWFAQLIHGESPRSLPWCCFSAIRSKFLLSLRITWPVAWKILAEIQKIDHHSETERDELERFLVLKIICWKTVFPRPNQSPPGENDGRNPVRIKSSHFAKLFAKIKEKSPILPKI